MKKASILSVFAFILFFCESPFDMEPVDDQSALYGTWETPWEIEYEGVVVCTTYQRITFDLELYHVEGGKFSFCLESGMCADGAMKSYSGRWEAEGRNIVLFKEDPLSIYSDGFDTKVIFSYNLIGDALVLTDEKGVTRRYHRLDE